jgi:hypothetical protein
VCGKLVRLRTFQEPRCHTKRAEGRTEQHHCGAAVRNRCGGRGDAISAGIVAECKHYGPDDRRNRCGFVCENYVYFHTSFIGTKGSSKPCAKNLLCALNIISNCIPLTYSNSVGASNLEASAANRKLSRQTTSSTRPGEHTNQHEGRG